MAKVPVEYQEVLKIKADEEGQAEDEKDEGLFEVSIGDKGI